MCLGLCVLLFRAWIWYLIYYCQHSYSCYRSIHHTHLTMSDQAQLKCSYCLSDATVSKNNIILMLRTAHVWPFCWLNDLSCNLSGPQIWVLSFCVYSMYAYWSLLDSVCRITSNCNRILHLSCMKTYQQCYYANLHNATHLLFGSQTKLAIFWCAGCTICCPCILSSEQLAADCRKYQDKVCVCACMCYNFNLLLFISTKPWKLFVALCIPWQLVILVLISIYAHDCIVDIPNRMWRDA